MTVNVVRDRPAALWIGDSYTHGTGGGGRANSASCLTSEGLGWTCQLDSQGGTGFVLDGKYFNPTYDSLPGRLKTTRARFAADVVIVDAGRNDSVTQATLNAISAYVPALKAEYPLATIVIIAPWWTDRDGPHALAAPLAAAAKEVDAYFVDPYTRGWAGPATMGHMTSTEIARHPTAEGFKFAADRLIEDFRTLGIDRVVKVTADARPSSP